MYFILCKLITTPNDVIPNDVDVNSASFLLVCVIIYSKVI